MPTLWLSEVALLLLRRLKRHTDIVLSESPVRNVGILLFCASPSLLAPIGYYFEPEVFFYSVLLDHRAGGAYKFILNHLASYLYCVP